MANPSTKTSRRIEWHRPAAGTRLDLSAPAYSLAPGSLPVGFSVDPRFDGAWRKLPGFRRISENDDHTRIVGSDVGLDDEDDVVLDFFRPIVVKYGSEPYERRGFVVAANNVLIFKYYDSKDETWAVRTLCDDMDARYGTRTALDCGAEGRFLYVSRCAKNEDESPTADSPETFWWDTQTWVQFDYANFDGDVLCACEFGGNLYVGGNFTSPGYRVARWTGTAWDGAISTSGGADQLTVIEDMTIFNSLLTVAGSMRGIGGVAAYSVAQFNGTVWTDLSNDPTYHGPGQLQSYAHCLLADGATLHVGGGFTGVPNGSGTMVNCRRYATVNSSGAWSIPTDAAGANEISGGEVTGIAKLGSDIYLGGPFTSPVNNGFLKHTAGVGYASVGSPSPSFTIGTLVTYDSKVWVGGTGGLSTWNGTSWANIDGLNEQAIIRSFLVDGTDLYVAGTFTSIGTVKCRNIAKWDGTEWSVLGSPTEGPITPASGGYGVFCMVMCASVTGLVDKLFVGGTFTSLASFGGYPLTVVNAALYAPDTSENSAQTGAALLRPWTLTAATVSGSTSAKFTSGKYYTVLVRFVDRFRGFASPPTQTYELNISSSATALRRMSVVPDAWFLQTCRPTAIQVWRSVGGTASGDEAGGPFYLDNEVPINPDLPYTTLTVDTGVLSDTALVQNDPFDFDTDLPGAFAASAAIAIHKGQLFALAGGRRPSGSLTQNESYWDLRWSPPQSRSKLEFSVWEGNYRVRASDGEERPAFCEVGDYLILATLSQVVRAQKAGDYVSFNDGPSNLGVLNAQAMAAVGGDLIFVSRDGRLTQLNSATGAFQTMRQFSRLFLTRWRTYIRKRQMSVAYDPSSQLLVVGPHLASDDDLTPTEALVIDMTTGLSTLIGGLFPRWMQTGTDPETGRDCMFLVTRTGVILSPDWTDHGAYEGHSTLNGRFNNTIGAAVTEFDVTDISGTTTTIDNADDDLPITSDPFPLAAPCVAYLTRQVDSASNDPLHRRQLVAWGVVTDNTDSTLTVDWNMLFGLDANDFADWDDLTLVLAPQVMQIWLPPLRDDQGPFYADDRVITETASVQFGETTDWEEDGADKDGAAYLSTFVLDLDGAFPLDVPMEDEPGVPLSTPDSDDPTLQSIPADTDIDQCAVNLQSAGHIVHPIVTVLGSTTGRNVELTGFVVRGRVEKGKAGTGTA